MSYFRNSRISTDAFLRECEESFEVFLREREENYKTYLARTYGRNAKSPVHRLEINGRNKISNPRSFEAELRRDIAIADAYMRKPRSGPIHGDPFMRFQAAREKSAIFLGVIANVFLVVATLASCTTSAVKSAFRNANAEAVERPKTEHASYRLPDDKKPVVNVVVDDATKRPALKSKVFMNQLNQ